MTHRALLLLVCLAPGLAAADETKPLHPGFAPLAVPAAFIAPGSAQLLRGERRAGGRMLAVSGISFGLTVAGAAFLGFSGASDLASDIAIPVMILGASTMLTLGFTDLTGAFADALAPPLTDTWDAQLRVGLALLAPMHTPARPSPELYASFRTERWLLAGRATTTVNGPGTSLEGTAGVLAVGYDAAIPRAGLWLELGGRGEWLLGSRTVRGRVALASHLPMVILGERFSRVSSVLRLGIDPTWVWFTGTGRPTFELPLSGGFEMHFTASENLRLFVGYEHAREGPVGGFAVGFLGSFFAGTELFLTPEVLVVARAQIGTPNAFTVGLEWRK